MPQYEKCFHWISVGHRGRRILSTSAWSLMAKASAAANLFLSVPFVLEALGPTQFGAWATVVSLVAFAGFADLGFGNGTMNLVAAAHGRGATEEVHAIYSEGRRSLLQVSMVLGAALFASLPFVPWHLLLGLPPALSGISRLSVAAVFIAVVLAVPLNLATRVQLGLARGERAFRWQAAGQVLTLLVVIALSRANATLPALTAGAVIPQLVTSAANTWQLQRDASMKLPRSASRPDIRHRIRKEGVMFFILQMSGALAFSADLPMISAFRGAADAGTYAVVQRLFSIIPLSLSLIWTPLWPIYRQALATGNHQWVTTTLRRSLLLATAFAACAASVILFGFGHITDFWMRAPMAVSTTLLTGFALWCVIEAAGTSMATFLNAASVMRYQVALAVIFSVSCVLSKAWAITNLGIAFVPWTTAVAYFVAVLTPTTILGRRLIASALAKEY